MKKTVLITGCSSGFGKASAKLFAAKGWNAIATMRRPEAEEELTKLADVLVTRLDVQERHSIEAGIARFGKIDALVNNAGFGLFGLFEATPPEKIEEQFDVNVFGVMGVPPAYSRMISPGDSRTRCGGWSTGKRRRCEGVS
ncbi:MAG TPA: SDR family NAD(P)-dependent oxidoreductase [Blastocatellia bacterium]|jgi:NAD(P)-dependent dehydrogenase (short-subunit alcohol dehydrogenase family)|nr:SDR family NAD(P)-dependent oxidoreductase [Blastocatellia bacterium]